MKATNNIMGYKFIPFIEMTDNLFQVAGWVSKAEFVEEFAYSTKVFADNTFPMHEGELGQLSEVTLERQKDWDNAVSNFEMGTMFIYGTPSRVDITLVSNFFVELGLHDDDEIKKGFEEADLIWTPSNDEE